MTTDLDINRESAGHLGNSLARLLREFSRDFERRIWSTLQSRGYPDVRPSHSAVFANIGPGTVRVTELAGRAQVTQQAMGKMLKELERMGYVARGVDSSDKRARAICLTERGQALAADCCEVVAEVRDYYAERIGPQELANLEAGLRHAVSKLELNYLPATWTDND